MFVLIPLYLEYEELYLICLAWLHQATRMSYTENTFAFNKSLTIILSFVKAKLETRVQLNVKELYISQKVANKQMCLLIFIKQVLLI